MSGRLLYDLTGLLHWYAYSSRPGGVQRVIEKVAACDAVRRSGKASSSSASWAAIASIA